ncbi:leucyl/phenylalanyl-tRNA--protein transferase [Desulfomicrobium baculatum]|uniref:Leucyl/phenylalanyl-tRNA--protein transferase n=1 Tax=Desulfomicrobium baculatum (strain DSM 4028 / VKM B-1378 / X) TaxID=525897 RepID=C7LNU5_DESBD|nr:leucyl/phenylalanyl-tRNA--protein transferase [Desulfomicrobium baculatum]ACU90169.1 leucyl/phenylalanyl-tRNA/protein transferase [Desulfomicrobium baculatum DSM 4028]
MTVFALPAQPVFPDPAHADEDGLLAVGGDLSSHRLLMAYGQGIFPWYNENSPILWWSPDPRLILEPARIHVPKRLDRILRQGRFRFTLDTVFEQVITRCAATPRNGAHGTWIVPEMLAAYCRLHELGFAHSIEVWSGANLAGGLYGVALGGAFFGESMFYLEPDASKAGLVTLMRALESAGFVLFDCQQTTAHMLRFGGFEVPRGEFLSRLEGALKLHTPCGHWSLRAGALIGRDPE